MESNELQEPKPVALRSTNGRFVSSHVVSAPLSTEEAECIEWMRTYAEITEGVANFAARLYEEYRTNWAGENAVFTPQLIKGWFKSTRARGWDHPQAMHVAKEAGISVEEVWRDGRIPTTGAGVAIVCNHCANASAPTFTDGHTVVIAYTKRAIWAFNSQVFGELSEDNIARAQQFSNIQLVRAIFESDIRMAERPWFHVPNGNDNCFSTACQTVLDLGWKSPEVVAEECVRRAKAHVRGLGGATTLKEEWQKIYKLRL